MAVNTQRTRATTDCSGIPRAGHVTVLRAQGGRVFEFVAAETFAGVFDAGEGEAERCAVGLTFSKSHVCGVEEAFGESAPVDAFGCAADVFVVTWGRRREC